MFSKKVVIILSLILLLNIFLVSAQPPFAAEFPEGYTIRTTVPEIQQEGVSINYHVHLYNASNGVPLFNDTASCYLHLYNETNQFLSSEMGFSDIEWEYEVGGGNFTVGNYQSIVFCNSSSAGGFTIRDFKVTPDGNSYEVSDSIIQSLFILFFIGLFVLVYYIKKEVNLEKLNNSIYEKYKNKNYIKLVISSIGYNIMKNSFVLYYLITFPIIVLLTDLAFIYGFNNLTGLLTAITIIYSVGIIVVGLIFISHVQEWFMDLLEKIKNMDWGVE